MNQQQNNDMPRNSIRKRLITRLELLITACIKRYLQLRLLGIPADREEALLWRLRKVRSQIIRSRYVAPRTYRKRQWRFDYLLGHLSEDDRMSDNEFLFHFRMTRPAFWELVELVKGHPAFARKSSDSRGRHPKRPECQLLVLLKYFGCEGNQASSKALSDFFGVASGIIDLCRQNALDAVLSLEDRTVIWPDKAERRIIANRIQETYLFPHCVGLIDGTLLPLATRPLLHGENYLSRKKFYAIVMIVVCDDLSRINYFHVGWPGSVHDNRVWRNCKMNRNRGQYFSKKQYLLGDSAFTASQVMIPPFKSSAGSTISNNKASFNTYLSKPRVKSEHCIGILKGRFPFLRHIRLRLGSKEDMDRIIDHVRGAVVLHNYLLTENEDDTWIEIVYEADDDLEEEFASIAHSEADYSRREELFFYLSELQETTIN
jgi:DDE superfamily endonuclease